MDWTTILTSVATGMMTAAIPAAFVFAGVWITQKGKREEGREEREERLESRMERLERDVDALREDLRSEQRFSHKMVLMLTRVLYYLRDAAAYRAEHGESLPGKPPPLPNADEIESLLAERPNLDRDN